MRAGLVNTSWWVPENSTCTSTEFSPNPPTSRSGSLVGSKIRNSMGGGGGEAVEVPITAAEVK